MQLTHVGLPNSCMLCGKKVLPADGWYAANDDAARAGSGVCAEDFEKQSAPAVAPVETHEPQTSDDDGQGPAAPGEVTDDPMAAKVDGFNDTVRPALDGMTKKQLQGYASKHGIALKPSLSKAAMIAAIHGASRLTL